MAVQVPALSFSLAPLPVGQALDANQYGQALVSNLTALISGNFLAGQIDGTPPTQNIGVWLNNGVWYVWSNSAQAYVPQTVAPQPAGIILMYGGLVAPSGYLLCDGSLYLRSAYPALFSAIGISYNPGDGVSTFGVPDFRSRSPVGFGQGSGLSNRSMGSQLGEELHSLLTAELATHSHGVIDPTHAHLITDPQHNHGINDSGHSHSIADPGHNHSQNPHAHGVTDPGHTHSYVNPLGNFQGNFGTNQYSPAGTASVGVSTTGITIQNASATNNASGTGIGINSSATGIGVANHATNISINPIATGISIQNIGSGTGHNNMQPSLVCGFIIKT